MNIKFKMSGTSISRVSQMIKPFKTEIPVCISFVKDNIVVNTKDIVSSASMYIGTEGIPAEWSDYRIFIQQHVFIKLSELKLNEVEFSCEYDGTAWTDLTLNIDGSLINIGLPMFDADVEVIPLHIDNAESESISALKVSQSFDIVSVADIKTSAKLGSVKLADSLVYGTFACIGVVRSFFAKSDILIMTDFTPYIENIAKLATELEFIADRDNQTLLVRADNVVYKSIISSNKISDINTAFNPTINHAITLKVEDIKSVLNRFEVAIGQNADAQLLVKVSGADLTLSIKDLQNRESHSVLLIANPTQADVSVSCSFVAFKNIINKANEDLELAFRTAKADSNQVVALMFKSQIADIYLVCQIEK